jgi:Xaa-Pro aminopeptidase
MSELKFKPERIRFPILTRELERRWSLVRAAMKKEGLDSLVMQNDNMWLGGYVRYFTDLPSEQAYPTTVIFPINDDIITISSGGPPMAPPPPDWACRGIGERIAVPYFRSFHYTNTLDAEEIVKVLKRRNDKRVGLLNLGLIPAATYLYIKEQLPSVEWVDATDLVDEIKAIKSADEIEWIRKAVSIQDMAAAAVPTIVRPGKYEYEIRSELTRILTDLGSEEQWIMIGSEKPGNRTGQYPTFFQNRRIEQGDQVLIMIEVNGPGGYYGELCRTWSLGEPPKELLRVWDIALEGQKRITNLIKPGVKPADLYHIHNDFLVSQGFGPEGRLFGHGQGYDLVERPALLPGETMVLKEGMLLAVHPTVFNDQAYVLCCDNFLINETGVELLHKTPQEIIVIE